MKLRRTGRTSLLFVVAVLACSDDDPAAPDLALEPSNYIKPYTGAACSKSNCLPGNVTAGWGITAAYSSTYTFTPWNVDARTERGSSVTAGFCTTRKSDGYSLGCQMIENWSRTSPYWGTGAVRIVGMDGQNRHRLYFDSYAPRPTIELLEFDRPETVSCNTTYMTCTGPFRLKVDLRNSDWYSADQIYLYAVAPDGTEIPLQPNYVKSGTTFEWKWTQLQGPGYRLLVRYHPWESTDDWMMEFSVPISGTSPQLRLDALESPGGPAVSQVPAGTSVFFTASAPGATSIDSLRWHWTPTDPTDTAQTAACAPDEISCTVAVLEEGTMHVVARVDGQTREAVAQVGVTIPELVVECDPTVERGQEISCRAHVEPAQPFRFIRWVGRGAGFSVIEEVGVDRSTGYSEIWKGAAVATTTVTAEAIVGTNTLRGSSVFDPTARDFPILQVPVLGTALYRAPYLRIPRYPTPGRAIGMFLLGKPMLSDIDSVTSGPNTGLYYLGSVSNLHDYAIIVHPALIDTSHPWHIDQNGFPSGTCNNGVVAGYHLDVLSHEGVNGSTPSHWGIANQLLATQQPEQMLEPLFERSGSNLESLVELTWVQYTQSTAYRTPHSAHDSTDRPEQRLPCRLDHNRSDG